MSLITDEQLDALQEFINIGAGRAAGMLNEMVESPILLNVPVLKVLDSEALKQEVIPQFNNQCLSIVKLDFTGSFSGSAELVFPTESASALVSLLTGEDRDSPDLDAVKIGTLTEVGNIVINGVMGSLSNLLKQRINYTLPVYWEAPVEQLLSASDLFKLNPVFLLAKTRFEVQRLEIIGDIILIFEMTSFSELLNCVDQEISLISHP